MQLTSIRNWLRLDTFRGRLPDEEEDQGLSERPDVRWVKPKAQTHQSAIAAPAHHGPVGTPLPTSCCSAQCPLPLQSSLERVLSGDTKTDPPGDTKTDLAPRSSRKGNHLKM